MNDTEMLDYIEKGKREVRFIPYGADGGDPDLDLWLVGDQTAVTLREAIKLDYACHSK